MGNACRKAPPSESVVIVPPYANYTVLLDYHIWCVDHTYRLTENDVKIGFEYCKKPSTWKLYLDTTMRDANSLSTYLTQDSCLRSLKLNTSVSNILVELTPVRRFGSFTGTVKWTSVNIPVEDVHSALEVWFDYTTALRGINIPGTNLSSYAVLKNVKSTV
jgi:hypothetical protein